MAAFTSEELTVDKKLSDVYNEGYKLFKKLETTSAEFNSSEYQNDVKKCIGNFEDSTRLVSLIGMFSSNENAEEIATDHLKYLLLPFYLGQLSTKLIHCDRKEVLMVAQVYYKDFIKRLEDYEICKRESENTEREIVETNNELRDLVQMAAKRKTKLEKYKQKMELIEQIKRLQIAIENDNVDEEIKRDFYMKLISSSVIETKDELECIKSELEILDYKKTLSSEDETTSKKRNIRPKTNSTPLNPIIITRNDAQKAVYGMGYPSLPVMTVNDFYNQRVREGIFPDPEKASAMNMAGMSERKTAEAEEKEREENEARVEADDEEYLNRQRAMDEYKDNVRRGDGNRHNRS